MLPLPSRGCMKGRTKVFRRAAISRAIATCAVALLSAAISVTPAGATHDPRHGDACESPGEDSSFLCGVVIVDIAAGTQVDIVLAACPPLGNVTEVAGQSYFVAVPVGEEVDFRDCYSTQEGVESAGLSYFGQVTPDTAIAVESAGKPAVALGIALNALALLTLTWCRRRGRSSVSR